MKATKKFRVLVQRRVATDAAFAEKLRHEAIAAMRTGDVATGNAILGDYVEGRGRECPKG